MTKYIPYLIYLLFIAMHEVFLKDLTSILGVTINLTILIVMLLSVYKSDLVVIWFGFFAAIIAFSGNSFVLGWHIAAVTLVGFVSCHLRERLNLDSTYAKLLLVFGGVLVHNIILLLFSNFDSFTQLMLIKVLPGAVYTSIIAWIFFLLIEENITMQKVKSIF